jgi:Putative GTPase activating protein for Arf
METSQYQLVELKLEQPVAVTSLLQDLLARDTYNKFCIDCNRLESTHANITYGTFVCGECAGSHLQIFGMEKSYIKPLFGAEPWDNYQLKIIQLGGNKKLWDFFKQYNGLEQKPISSKYKAAAASYYRKRLAAETSNMPFD